MTQKMTTDCLDDLSLHEGLSFLMTEKKGPLLLDRWVDHLPFPLEGTLDLSILLPLVSLLLGRDLILLDQLCFRCPLAFVCREKTF